MPYSTDIRRLEEMLPYLGSLAQGLTNVQWRVDTGSPNTVAFRIREALWLAVQYPVTYPELAKYARDYSIRVDGSLVIARRRTPVILETPVADAPPPPAVSALQVDASLLRKPPKVTPAPFDTAVQSQNSAAHEGPQSPEQIITFWTQAAGLKRTLYFPDAGLSEKELAELWLWAESESAMLLVVGKSITVARRDPHALAHSYKPDPEFLAKEFGL